jgi:hypothetical protein
MQRTISLAASISLVCLLCTLLPANAEDVPRRKAGLWELTTIGAGSGTNKATTCIGENDKILSPEGGNCSARGQTGRRGHGHRHFGLHDGAG